MATTPAAAMVPVPEAVLTAGLAPVLPPPPSAGRLLRGDVAPRPATAVGIARTLPTYVVEPQASHGNSWPVTAAAPTDVAPEVRSALPDFAVPIGTSSTAYPGAAYPGATGEMDSRPAGTGGSGRVTVRDTHTLPAIHEETGISSLFGDDSTASRPVPATPPIRSSRFYAPEGNQPEESAPRAEEPVALRDAPPAFPDGRLVPDLAQTPPNSDGLDGMPMPRSDGFDGAMGSKPYHTRPMAEIRPYFNYSPEEIPLCPTPDARCPEMKPLPESTALTERYYPHLDYLWVPANIFSMPLYFEDPALERYGHSHGPLVQPLASTSRFALQFVSLPYQMALDPPHRRVYPLGYFRPGECAPKQVPNVPLNAEAAVKAGAVYTGLIFAWP